MNNGEQDKWNVIHAEREPSDSGGYLGQLFFGRAVPVMQHESAEATSKAVTTPSHASAVYMLMQLLMHSPRFADDS